MLVQAQVPLCSSYHHYIEWYNIVLIGPHGRLHGPVGQLNNGVKCKVTTPAASFSVSFAAYLRENHATSVIMLCIQFSAI